MVIYDSRYFDSDIILQFKYLYFTVFSSFMSSNFYRLTYIKLKYLFLIKKVNYNISHYFSKDNLILKH